MVQLARLKGKTRGKRCGVSEEFNNKYSVLGKVRKCQKGEQKEIHDLCHLCDYAGYNNLKTKNNNMQGRA